MFLPHLVNVDLYTINVTAKLLNLDVGTHCRTKDCQQQGYDKALHYPAPVNLHCVGYSVK